MNFEVSFTSLEMTAAQSGRGWKYCNYIYR